MKIIVTKAELASLIRNCVDAERGYNCGNCPIRDLCNNREDATPEKATRIEAICEVVEE